jgi:hypothetical protein
MRQIKENADELQKVIDEKMRDIVSLLDLFQGQLSLTDVMNQDIPLLSALRNAKSNANMEYNRERERQQQLILQQQTKK